MLKYFFAIFFLLVVTVVAIAGFRGGRTTNRPIEIFNDMDRQPKYVAQHTSTFFADGRAARPPVPGTIPMGYTMEGAYYATGANNNRAVKGGVGFAVSTDYYSTGKMGDVWGDGIPFEVTEAVMERGRQRFNINCAVCHGEDGGGNGPVKNYGLKTIAMLVDERITNMPDGEIFNTITNGKNTMNPYGPQITIEDRWCIISYLRALQTVKSVPIGELPQNLQTELDKPVEQPAAQ